MITRTIKTSTVEYTTFNRETDDIQIHVTDLIGTFANEDEITKALKSETLPHEMILKAKVVDITTFKYSMAISQFINLASKQEVKPDEKADEAE